MASIQTAKKGFFDRQAVMDKVDAATRKSLNKAGASLRLIAQRSMRYVSAKGRGKKPRRVSRPGEPPRAVREHPWLRKHLYYSYDDASETVVVGPVGFRGEDPVPGTLERGGLVTIRNARRRRRTSGDGGEIAIGLAGGHTTKLVAGTLLGTVPVTYARLRTVRQVAKANRINERLYGPMTLQRRIAARPFMRPALEKASKRMSRYFANSVTAG